MFKSLIAFSVGVAIGTAASSSPFHPAILNRNVAAHHDALRILSRPEILRRLARGQLPRRAQVEEESCPGTPFLWKIVENSTGNHVGFGIGTMHLPPDLVTTNKTFDSLISAVEDSCDVYGEVNSNDIFALVELLTCTFTAISYSATLNDIPDEGLRDEVKAKISEITMQYGADQNTTEIVASNFDAQPIGNALNFIIHGNTPEFMEVYGDTLFTGEPTGLLDSEILKLGRPSGGLEDMEVTCDLIYDSFQTLDALNETYASDPDAYAAGIRESINASLSPLLHLYKCGDIDALKESGIFHTIENGEDLVTFERNNQMVAKIHEILTARNSDEKITFAVGLAHWLFGSENMISLLEDYGYSMELIADWDETQAENPSNEFCGVVENPDVSIFSPSLYVDEASLNATYGPSPAPDDMSMVPTTTTTTEENSLSINTSSPTSASEGMTTVTTDVVPPTPSTLSPSSKVAGTTNIPTAIPIQGAEKEVVPEPLPPSGSTAIELSKILFVWGWISLVW
ncbi:hypothetical protein ACHAXH_000427 [Discostella pseudostelligera]